MIEISILNSRLTIEGLHFCFPLLDSARPFVFFHKSQKPHSKPTLYWVVFPIWQTHSAAEVLI